MATNELMSGTGAAGGDDADSRGAELPVPTELAITIVRTSADRSAAEALVRRHQRAELAPGAGEALEAQGEGISDPPRPGHGSRLLLARRGALPVGVARICWAVARRAGEVRRGTLSHLYVAPEARSTGVGEALVRRAAVVAWWSGCHDLRVRNDAWPSEALARLERAGFAPAEGTGSDDAEHPVPSELVLRSQPLDPPVAGP